MATETRKTFPEVGKIPAETFERIIRPRLGAPRGDVLVGPRGGVDNGIIDLGEDRVLALTCDPFFVMPELGWERAGWLAVHIVASDAATSGLAPAHFTVDLNLPVTMTDEELSELWAATSDACTGIGLSIVTGHTGRYEGCAFPMLGGATIVGVGNRNDYLTPAMARPGDLIIVTKGAAIETTGMFGALCPRLIAAGCGDEIAGAAAALFWQLSTVEDARTAVEAGVRDAGVTGMHDATERGIWGGLAEIAETAGVGLAIERDAILIRPEARAVCELFGIDPFMTSSEGTLLITCRPAKVGEVIERLDAAGIAATAVGEVTPASHGSWVMDGAERFPLAAPEADPFWPALRRAMDEEARRAA